MNRSPSAVHSRRGFTLIELLVVIAIIGVLSAIIMVSLNSARTKGADTAVKKAMVEARTQAELFYTANGNRYSAPPLTATDSPTNVCSPSGMVNGTKGMYDSFLSAAEAAGVAPGNIYYVYNSGGTLTRATCHACPPGIVSGSCGGANSNAWGMEVPLKGGGMWCMDSTGFNGYNSVSRLASGDTLCI